MNGAKRVGKVKPYNGEVFFLVFGFLDYSLEQLCMLLNAMNYWEEALLLV